MPYITASVTSETPVNIFYQDWGNGKPVILIHGWPVCHNMWEYQMNVLPKNGIRVIAYDRRGFGKSDKPWDGYDYDTLAADLKALIDELDLDNVTLVGFSMGGGEVARYLSLYGSNRIEKAVFVSSIVPFLLQTDSNPNGVPQEMFDGMEEKLTMDRPDFLAAFGKQFFGVTFLNNAVSQPLLDWMQMLALEGSLRATVECLKAFATTDFRDDMLKINGPTLIIHGASDQTVPIEPTGKQAANAIANAVFIVYDGEPHGLFITQKERLTKDLLAFIL
jgi:pimeloyl-ACP methyl ester carboxylesterase